MNRILHLVVIVLLIPSVVKALSLNLCSNTNLGGDKTSYQYMSNGYCSNTCSNKGYSVAILSGYDCYCTNNVPADTVDMSNCQVGCPGYKDQENCAGAGYFGYLVISNPSATIGAISSSTTSSSTSTSSSGTSSSTSSTSSTSTPSSTTTSSSSSSTTTSSSSTSSTTTSSSSTSSSTTSTPTTLITRTTEITQTHLSNNIVKITEYFTETITPSKATSSSLSSSSSSLSSEDESSESPLVSTKIEPSTIYSILTINGTQTQEVQTIFVTKTPTILNSDSTILETGSISNLRSQDASATLDQSSTSTSLSGDESLESSDGNNTQHKNSFFDDTGKVAGTFSAVGIVVVGIVCAILYCCCCFGGGRSRKGGNNGDNDGFTDEENQYSSDEMSVNHEKIVIPHSKQSSFSSLKRDSSGKSLFAYFTGDKNSVGDNDGINRSSSRKKLVSRRNSSINNHNGGQTNGVDDGIMFPINELDSRLDPDTMFLNHNFSNKSFGDDHDYSRKLKITNPE